MSKYVNAANAGSQIRYARARTPFYSWGSWRQGLSTDAVPSNIIGVETGEAYPSNPTAGLQCAINLMTKGISQKDASLALITEFFGQAPAVASISLQLSDIDQDSSYKTFLTSTLTTGDYLILTGVQANFARVLVNSITQGGSPPFAGTFAAKILVQ